jgi:photosystem II stability/assembly factor-like uncharacterized protein
MSEVLLLVGTGKGLFQARSSGGRSAWSVTGPQFMMNAIYSIGVDTRRATPRLLVGAQSEHWGPSVFHSDDLGESWEEPDHGALKFPADADTSLERVWQLQPAPADQPDVVYAGVEPSALFKSTDGGQHFELVRPLWDHPHRKDWTPGFGGMAIHTVLPHPSDANKVVVAMSTGGVYRTEDGGENWAASNTGIKAYFLPDQFPEFGQCVHKIARNPERPDQFFLQNHHGVYRSDDGAASWTSIADGLPSDFGFPMVTHPRRPGVAYNFPLTADGERVPPEAQCRVFRTEDEGKTWTALSDGLPDGFYGTVLRDAMCTDDADPVGVYFGTRNGELYASADEGEHWQSVAAHLPDVLCVRAVVVG